MANKVDALINVKDASGVLNEIYPITKKENVQGLAEFISNSLSGYAKKTNLNDYLNKIYSDPQTIESPLTIEGNVNVRANLRANSMSLYTEPTESDDVVNKSYLDKTIAKLPMHALVINADEITNYQTTAEAINDAVIVGREVLLKRDVGSNTIYYHLDTSKFTNKITQYTTYHFYSIADEQTSGFIMYALMKLQNDTITYSSKFYIPKAATITLTSAGWDSTAKSQTVTVSYVTTTNIVTVSPATKASADVWAESGVFCTEQGKDTLTFTCTDIPTADISVNVMVEG